MKYKFQSRHDLGMNIALCQIPTRQWDIERNFRATIDALNQAADKGSKLAVTPECVLHGYPQFTTPEDMQRMRDTAEFIDGERISGIRELALRRNMNIVIGFAEQGQGLQFGSVHHVRW